MHRGFVKLWRKSKDSKMYRNHKLWVLWTYILMNAAHKPYKAFIGNQVIGIRPGQFVATLKELSRELEISEKEIRARLGLLEKGGCISRKGTNKFTLITVIKWDVYQGRKSVSDKQRADKGHTEGNPRTNEPVIPIYKNIKECEEEGRSALRPEKKNGCGINGFGKKISLDDDKSGTRVSNLIKWLNK